MTERIAIIAGVRTPLAKVIQKGNVFSDLSGVEMLQAVMGPCLERAGVAREQVDHVIFGTCIQRRHPHNVTRVGACRSGLPDSASAVTVHQSCASGLTALMSGARQLMLGEGDVALVGGMEKMTGMSGEELADAFFDPVCDRSMPSTADLLFREYGITREEQDIYSFHSHRKALAAREQFKEEIIPVGGLDYDTGVREVTQEKHMRLVQRLYRAHLAPGTENITPGNSCQNTDGAAALVLARESYAKQTGLRPKGYVRSFATVGVDPRRMGLGPVAAIKKALDRAGWTLDQVDVLEINEAFAAQCLAVYKELGVDRERVNPNGGAIALGHPVACTGARIMVSLLYEMERRNARRGLAALCVGGGQGTCVLVERDQS